MELSGLLDITIEQGATFELNFVDEDENGPLDYNGATTRMQIRRTKKSPTTIISLTEGSGIVIDHDAAEVNITITDEQTTAFKFDHAFYDVETVFSDGTVDRILEGRVSLSKEVTR